MQPLINWEEVPFLRLLLPLLAGIGLAIWLPQQINLLLVAALLLWLLMAALHNWKKWRQQYRSQWIFGFMLSVLLMLLGYILVQQNRQINHPNHFSRFLTDSSFVLLQVNEPPIAKPKSLKATVRVLQVHNGTEVVHTVGNALVYFEKDTVFNQLKYGNVLLAKTDLKEVLPPKNPGEFNFKRYLSYQQLYHQAYLKAHSCQILPVSKAHPLYAFVYQLRSYLINAINTYLKAPDEQGVAAALLLGYTHFLKDELQQTYSHTGTIHVLAVSGLHVGIIYLFLNGIFSFLDKRGKKGLLFKTGLIIAIIWLYAMLVGLPPSVSRAAGMFTLFAMAQVFGRHTNFYNILATAAFLMLLYDPFLVTRIGFQLSYIAVAGIVFYQPLIYSWFNISNKFLDKIWQVSSVTLAAQLATLPLILYYFAQFPTYFLFANLLTVPLAGVLLPLGFIFFIVSPLAFLAKPVAYLLEILFWLLNTYLYYIKQLPLSVIEGLTISGTEMVMLYMLIGAFTLFFLYKQSVHLRWALGSLLLICSSWAVMQYKHLNYKEICIYHYKGGTAIEFIKGYNSVVLADSAGLEQYASLSTPINERPNIKKRQYLNLHQQNNPDVVQTPDADLLFPDKLYLKLPFMQFYNRRLVVLHDSTFYCPIQNTDQKMQVNYLLLTQNCPIPLQTIQTCYTVDTLIADGSNKPWRTQKWTTLADSLQIPLLNTQVHGALVRPF
ncbi:MAG TPA: ComEC/Rec2 family competence protein [Chitinophagales bacterium]|nr:ComEC/Rec2 family competence protein [Chitinophagales bacterium]HRK27762.1 ComEC/Rec2 family competence protein [Chitinophagales bacterium]